MKVLAIHPPYSRDDMPGAIVELSPREVEIITGLDHRHNSLVRAGATIDICDRFSHSQLLSNQIEHAKSLPGTLRALADTLELTRPALDALTQPPPEST